MPGFYTPTPLQRSGDRMHLFESLHQQPPAETEASGVQVTDSDHATRKRYRHDELASQSSAYPSVSTPSHTDSWSDALSYSYSSIKSPPPLANDRYELAQGMEATDRFTRHAGNYDDYFELETRRGTWAAPATTHTDMPITPPATSSKPWMLGQLMNIMGGVAEKLYQFCAVPFRGFQAGGGEVYTFGNEKVAAQLGFLEQPSEQEHKPTQPPPREFVEEDFGVHSIESLDNERPAAKRQRTAESWVVVQTNGNTLSSPPTPRLAARRVPGHTRSPSQIPRPVSRVGVATPVRARPSLIPVSRRSTMDKAAIQGALKLDTEANASPRSYSRQGYSSPVMFNDKTPKKKHSPLPAESQRLINKMRREEVEEDERMRRMSSQMSAMLREAQEALGSKFEVQDLHMDDGIPGEDMHARTMRMFPR